MDAIFGRNYFCALPRFREIILVKENIIYWLIQYQYQISNPKLNIRAGNLAKSMAELPSDCMFSRTPLLLKMWSL
jgi:hypothetical protein